MHVNGMVPAGNPSSEGRGDGTGAQGSAATETADHSTYRCGNTASLC